MARALSAAAACNPIRAQVWPNHECAALLRFLADDFVQCCHKVVEQLLGHGAILHAVDTNDTSADVGHQLHRAAAYSRTNLSSWRHANTYILLTWIQTETSGLDDFLLQVGTLKVDMWTLTSHELLNLASSDAVLLLEVCDFAQSLAPSVA